MKSNRFLPMATVVGLALVFCFSSLPLAEPILPLEQQPCKVYPEQGEDPNDEEFSFPPLPCGSMQLPGTCTIYPEQGEDPDNLDPVVAPPESAEVENLSEDTLSSNQKLPGYYIPGDRAFGILVPCWATEDECTGDYRLPLGHAYGWYIGGALPKRDAASTPYYAAGRCGYGSDIGDIPSTEFFVVYVAYSMAGDTSSDDSGQVKFKIDLYEYTETDCTGDINRNFSSDTAKCTITSDDADEGWQSAWSDSKRDCSGSYGDPGDCHMPDIGVGYPGTAGEYSYKYYIETKVCDSDGTNCSETDKEYGCFRTEWTI